MATNWEKQVVTAFRTLCGAMAIGSELPGLKVPHALGLALEHYLPGLFREVYGEWEYETLDGVLIEQLRKLGPQQAEVTGYGILMSDQTITPFCLRLCWYEGRDQIHGLDCRMGENGSGKMQRLDYNADRGLLLGVAPRLDDIEWHFHIGFGATT